MNIKASPVVLAFIAVVGCSSDEPAAMEQWVPYPAESVVADKSNAEWAVEWSRWAHAQTSCESPVTDIDGSQCELYQDPDSPVFFLAFAPSKAVRKQCMLPRDKSILVPIVTFTIDNIGEEPPLEDEVLAKHAQYALDAMRDQKLVIDGAPYPVTADHAVSPTKHTVQLPKAPNYYSCQDVPGYEDFTLDPVYVSGYFVLLPPPSPGPHSLSYAGAQDIFGISEVSLANMQLQVAAP